MPKSYKNYKFTYDEVGDVLEVIDSLRSSFDELELLFKGSFKVNGKEITTEGTFDDILWAWENPLKHSYVFFDFSEVSLFSIKTGKFNITLLIKAWLANLTLSDRVNDFNTVKKYFRSIIKFISITDNFNERYIDNSNGNFLNDFFTDFNVIDVYKLDTIAIIMDFLTFLDNVLEITDDVYLEYLSQLNIISKQYGRAVSSKDLPGSKDIVVFSYYLSKLYEENENEDLKLLYMPILIWWKLSNVIPLRISEITRKLYRDCVERDGEKYYLKIRRLKSRRKSKNALPVLDRVEISIEMAELIINYIKLTEPYGYSKTLFSLRALNATRKKVLEKGYHYRHQSGYKFNESYFSSVIFTNLLNAFYEDIIFRYYSIKSIQKKVSPSDTRHFAFFSLLLQGVSPIQIALLGGHSTLHTQANYQNEVNYYVDSELFKLLNLETEKKEFISPYKLKTLKEIVFSMPKELKEKKNLLPLTVGYCNCDFEKGESCTKLKYCHLCSKWWCEPTKETYLKLVDYVRNSLLEEATKELNDDLNFLKKYLSNTFVANESGDFITDYQNEMKVKTISSKVKEDCDLIVDLRYSLVEFEDDNDIKNLQKCPSGLKYFNKEEY